MNLKDKDYAKAFKLLTHRLRKATGDSKAMLCMRITPGLTAIVTYRVYKKHDYMFIAIHNSQRRTWSVGNCLHHDLIKPNHALKFFSSSTMTGVSRDKFMQIWLDNAIGNELCIEVRHYGYAAMHMILDKNETIASLCVEYDLNV